MRTSIIAEIASSHNGDLDLAKTLIRAAAENGADIVKFQDWRAANVPANDPDKSRYERYEFKDEWYPILIDYCKKQGVEFLTSCFNVGRVEFLASLGLKKIKIASISAQNHDLIIRAAANFDELIVSTAMHTDDELEELIDLLATNAQQFTIMHCVANYPLELYAANLDNINTLKLLTDGIEYAQVGYSDHALDLDVAKAAIAMGITHIEKHFTLSRDYAQIPHQMYQKGPLITTHEIAIVPSELQELAEWRDKLAVMTMDMGTNPIEQKIKDRYLNRYGK